MHAYRKDTPLVRQSTSFLIVASLYVGTVSLIFSGALLLVMFISLPPTIKIWIETASLYQWFFVVVFLFVIIPLAPIISIGRVLARRFRRGVVTISSKGLALEWDGTKQFISWHEPIRARRWGVKTPGYDVVLSAPTSIYREVLELTQGDVQIHLTHPVNYRKMITLPLPPSEPSLDASAGHSIPSKAFKAILKHCDFNVEDARRET